MTTRSLFFFLLFLVSLPLCDEFNLNSVSYRTLSVSLSLSLPLRICILKCKAPGVGRQKTHYFFCFFRTKKKKTPNSLSLSLPPQLFLSLSSLFPHSNKNTSISLSISFLSAPPSSAWSPRAPRGSSSGASCSPKSLQAISSPCRRRPPESRWRPARSA